jgi:colicin import membrane protein
VKERFDFATILSIAMHATLVIVLMFKLDFHTVRPASANAVSIKAVAMDQTIIAQQDAALEAAQQEQERLRLEREAQQQREREEREQAARDAQERERQAQELERQKQAEAQRAEEEKRQAAAEAERKTKADAERKAKAEAERKAKAEAERKAKAEAERKAKAEAERKAKAEAERKAKEEAQRKAKAEAERKAKEEAARKAKAQAERKAKEKAERIAREKAQAAREAELAAMLAFEDQRTAAVEGGLLNEYMALVTQKLRRNWNKPANVAEDMKCIVNVVQIVGGEVIEVTVKRCNADTATVRSIEAAVFKSSPLPAPPDPSLFERVLEVEFVP